MSIFSAGIVWDPREPLPLEYPTTAYFATGPTVPTVPTLNASNTRTPRVLYQYPGASQSPIHVKTLPNNVVQEPDRNVLPAVSVSIEAQITGDVAEVTARQFFWNDADVSIHKGSYTFALPNGCTVTGFNCRVGNGKVLKAKAHPKAEAREAFRRAVASHATAALLEQNTPEIFTSSLGNIPPNTRIKAEITYVTILKRRFGEDKNTTTLTIPTYIANRYGQRPLDLQGRDLESKPDDISLRMEILQSEQIHSITSESHEILVERGTEISQALTWDDIGKAPEETKHESAIVKMKEATGWLDTDLILTINTACNKGHDSPHAWLELHPSIENHAAMMVTLPPRMLLSHDETPNNGEIVFVADRSGSMVDKMGNLRSAMHFFLKGIPLGRTFNIWSFGSRYESLWAKSQVYRQESLQMALNYVDTNFHADMGGTELFAALQAIISTRDPSLLCEVVILTDGEVWRLDETLRLVGRANETSNGAVRFFSLGIGAHVSHALVEGIAKQGGGYSEVIPLADRDGWEERLVAMLKATLTSHVRNLRLDVGDLKAMTSPADLGSLNPFQAHRIFLLLDQGTIPEDDAVAFTLMSDGKRTSIDVSKLKLEKPGMLIHSLAARAVLDDLERAPLAYWTTEENESDISSLAENIACKYSLPSKWTSLFLSQEDNEVSEGGISPCTIAEITISRAETSFLRPRGQALKLSTPPNRVPSPRTPGPIPPRPPTPGPARPFRIPGPSPPTPEPSPRTPGLSPYTPGPSPHTPGPRRPVPVYARPDCYNSGSSDCSSRYGSPTSVSPIITQSCAEKEFISAILSYQAFDGSVANEIMAELPEVVHDVISGLKNWVYERTSLNDLELDLVANTALIVALLETDYQDYKDLWAMIREKALEYILRQVSHPAMRNELLEHAREKLKVLGEPIHLKRKAQSSTAVGRGQEIQKYFDATAEDPARSDRVLVNKAPID